MRDFSPEQRTNRGLSRDLQPRVRNSKYQSTGGEAAKLCAKADDSQASSIEVGDQKYKGKAVSDSTSNHAAIDTDLS